MSLEGRGKEHSRLPAFRAEVQSFPDEEKQGAPTALAIAIAEAAGLAANHLAEEEMPETEFEVSRIQVKVAPNPGPTAYKVTITPTG